MAGKKNPTRQLLLEAAGELFASNGFAATSTRMIAAKSHQNVAAVNYHFGSKQNLFNAALKYVLERIMTRRPQNKSRRRQDIETEFASYIEERTSFLLSPQMPSWYGELIVRALLVVPGGLEKNSIAILSPDFDYLENLARRFDKTIDRASARRWAYSVIGQIFFYVLGRSMILLANDMPSYSRSYIETVARQIYEFGILWLRHRSEVDS